MPSPLVSIVVLFHNERSAEEAVRCLKALKNQTIADQIEIILVSNAANGSALKIIGDERNDPRITLIEAKENIGYGRGNNLGAQSATGEYLLILNPDNRLEPHALETMIAYLKEHHDVGIVGAKLIFPNGTVRDSYRSFPTLFDIFIKRTALRHLFPRRMKNYLQSDQDPTVIRDVDWMCGACLLLPRSLYEKLGGFDERFFLFFEDCDLCRRVWKMNLRVVYLPTAVANDNEQRLSAGGILSFFTKKTVRIHTASAIKYFWKWKGVALLRY
ncbi:MAG TPA: glycosyltransferase family 2 protein [Candidatus Peribacterales bacterium]|nr:glycosyltransferase family 2 protein [Candidatus Peribacterales bacterium]